MNMANFIKYNNKLASVSETHTVLKISTKHNETNVLGVHLLLFLYRFALRFSTKFILNSIPIQGMLMLLYTRHL